MIDARSQFVLPAGRKPNSPANLIGIAVHHSVTHTLPAAATEDQERSALRNVERYHIESAGFGLFAYHFATFPSGRIYQVGNVLGQRSHVAGRNHELVGIVNMGTFTDSMPGPKQLAAVGEGIRYIRREVGKYLPAKGHGIWALPGQGTACAGGPMNALTPNEWDRIALLGEEDDMEYVRHNRIADWFDSRDLSGTPDGEAWVMQAQADFKLPDDAQAVQFAVWMDAGETSWFDGGSLAEAGRAGARGVGYCVVQRALLADARAGQDAGKTLNFRAEGDCKIGRIFCLGFWR